MPLVLSLFISLVPILFFVALVLWWDRREPEPKRLLAKLFFAGAFCWIIIFAFLQSIQIIFVSLNMAAPFDLISKTDLLSVLTSAVLIAFLNEIIKIIVAKRLAFANRAFNQTVDGIVYLTTIAWGAALMDNFYRIYLISQKGDQLTMSLVLESAFAFIFLPLVMGISSGFSGLSMGRVHQQLLKPAISFEHLMTNPIMIKGFAIAVIVQAVFRTLVSLDETRYAGLIVLLSAIYLFSNFSAYKFNKVHPNTSPTVS